MGDPPNLVGGTNEINKEGYGGGRKDGGMMSWGNLIQILFCFNNIEKQNPKIMYINILGFYYCGEDGARTHDLLAASQAL